MRLYTFGNYYLSSIQQGIQAAHVVSEMSVRYAKGSPQYDMYVDWALNHKTIICLNGGNNKTLIEDVVKPIEDFCYSYPNAVFYEDEQSLGSILTCFGVIVPEYIYNQEQNMFGHQTPEYILHEIINSKGLAR